MPAAQSYASSEESPAATIAAMIARTTKTIAPMATTGLPSPMRLVCEEGDCGEEGAGCDHEATGSGDEGALPARTGACHTAWAATVGAAGSAIRTAARSPRWDAQNEQRRQEPASFMLRRVFGAPSGWLSLGERRTHRVSPCVRPRRS